MPAQLNKPIYMDYNATSPLRSGARAAMLDAMDEAGNPSSVHSFGRAARKRIEDARVSILSDLGLPTYRLVFTSGASEALATVLRPDVQSLGSKRHCDRLVLAASEHVAALDGHGFAKSATHVLPLDAHGVVDLASLDAQLAQNPTQQTMVAVHGANNETGVLQPLEAISTLCANHGALFVCDLVQWAGRLALGHVRPAAIVLSAHKLGGPTGVGALAYDPARLLPAQPLIRGGGQERGVRAGTENMLGIVGFAAAIREASITIQADNARLGNLRDGFEAELRGLFPDVTIFGEQAARLANTSCFAVPGHAAALALMQLDLAGIACSSGSACSSGKVKPSHVLSAMGVAPDLSACALRVSLGFGTNERDIAQLLMALSVWTVQKGAVDGGP